MTTADVARAEDWEIGDKTLFKDSANDLLDRVSQRALATFMRRSRYQRCRAQTGLPWRRGAVWTTDAFYRENTAEVRHYQARGVLAVDLEMAAVFAVGAFRGLPVAGLLAVSDELFTLQWRSGQRSPAFKQGREAAARLALAALVHWEMADA